MATKTPLVKLYEEDKSFLLDETMRRHSNATSFVIHFPLGLRESSLSRQAHHIGRNKNRVSLLVLHLKDTGGWDDTQPKPSKQKTDLRTVLQAKRA